MAVVLTAAPMDFASTTASAAPTACFSRDLYKGTRGEDVKLLQSALNFVGFRRGPVDGVFGNATKNGYKRLERLMGWRVDGFATMSELSWGACAPETVEPVQQQSSAAPAPVTVAVGQPPVPAPAAAVSEPAPAAAAPAVPAGDTLLIPALGMQRPIVVGMNSQSTIDACRGAVLFDGGWPGSGVGTYLAAHRTSCGDLGFNGIQNLSPGTEVVLRHAGVETTFVVEGVSVGIVGTVLQTPRAGVLVLQTSKSGNEVWVVTARVAG